MAVVIESRTLQGAIAGDHRGAYDGATRKQGSRVRIAVDTLGHLLALNAPSVDKQDRPQVRHTAKAVQKATGRSVEMAYFDQGYAGD